MNRWGQEPPTLVSGYIGRLSALRAALDRVERWLDVGDVENAVKVLRAAKVKDDRARRSM